MKVIGASFMFRITRLRFVTPPVAYSELKTGAGTIFLRLQTMRNCEASSSTVILPSRLCSVTGRA